MPGSGWCYSRIVLLPAPLAAVAPGRWPKHSWTMTALLLTGVGLMFQGQLIADIVGIALIAVGGGLLTWICWKQKVSGTWNRATREAQRRYRQGLATCIFVLSLGIPGFQIYGHYIAGPPSVRIKYSSTQVIQMVNEPGRDFPRLNLDNVGLLVPAGAASLNSIQLHLAIRPPVSVEVLEKGKRYPSGDGDLQLDWAPGWDVRGYRSFLSDREFTFDRNQSPTHVVEVGGRRFKVTLTWIADKSTPPALRFVEYTFAITEE